MHVVEAVRLASDPVEIAPPYQQTDNSGPYPRRVVPQIDAAVDRAAEELMLFSELDLPWAQRGAAATRG
jgi:hypothetical protein